MNEAQRLVYLEALGIQQWIAKAALPNAKATEFYVQDLQTDVVNVSASKINAVQEPISLQQSTITDVQDQKIIQTVPQQIKQTAAVSISKDEKPKVESYEQKIATLEIKPAMPACALQVQGKRGQYLIIADLHDQKGKIDSKEQNLLNNISKGINSLLANTSTRPIVPEQFKWPMFESHFKAEHIDQSEQAAKESAQAFLFSHIKRNQLPLVIALGERVHFLLGLNNLETDVKIMPNFGETRFILAASLTEMMQTNAQSMKAELWKSLVKHFV